MDKLTTRQQQVLDLIRDLMVVQGMPPTRAEIAKALGFRSLNAAEEHLKTLARKGVIELLPGASRGIRLRESGKAAAEELPLVGRVAAGAPILAQEHIEGYYRCDKRLFRPRPDYLLRVRGMSMRDAGILDGDLLVVHRTPEARDGQVVVARLGEEVTVKRFAREGGQVRLVPENSAFAPMAVDPAQGLLVIEGVAVGVIRSGKL
ncbi:MAG: transcriptional repressor LexA [Pseudomonadota bacterium]|nr:transcriptional repressor LexA [Pseudomonadota bacterium]